MNDYDFMRFLGLHDTADLVARRANLEYRIAQQRRLNMLDRPSLYAITKALLECLDKVNAEIARREALEAKP